MPKKPDSVNEVAQSKMISKKKCAHTLKAATIVLMIVTFLSFLENKFGGKRVAVAIPSTLTEEETFEELIRRDEERLVPGLGAGGEPAELGGRDKQYGEASEKKYAMNVFLSNKIPYNRTLNGLMLTSLIDKPYEMQQVLTCGFNRLLSKSMATTVSGVEVEVEGCPRVLTSSSSHYCHLSLHVVF